MKNEITVGMKLYLDPVNNEARYGNDKILEVEVTKVGRKYFYVEPLTENKFSLDTLEEVSDYAEDYKVYFTEQEILDGRERDKLYSEIGMKFGTFSNKDLTITQLRRIKEIIRE